MEKPNKLLYQLACFLQRDFFVCIFFHECINSSFPVQAHNYLVLFMEGIA